MPSDENIKAAVKAALTKRNAAASAKEVETLVRVVMGRLRIAIDQLPLDQVAQKMTDLFLEGRRDMPPEAHRPQMRKSMQSAFKTVKVPVPPDTVIEALVNVATGWMADHSLPTLPGGRTVVVHNVAGLYMAGL